MEDRRVLATFTVTSAADSGAGSLRDMVAAANAASSDDEIVFDAALDGATINLQTQIELSPRLTIDASALSGGLTIDASGADATPGVADGAGIRIFDVIDDGNYTRGVTLDSLTLTGTDVTGNGGAVRSESALTLRDTTITGNSATGSGGGVWLSPPMFTISAMSGVTVSNNTSGFSGGGVRVSLFGQATDLRVEQSTVSGNIAGAGGGGFHANVNYRATMSLDQIMIQNNEGAFGGGLYVSADESGATTIDHCEITGNTSTNSAGGVSLSADQQSQIDVLNCQIVNNSAPISAGGLRFATAGDARGTFADGTISGNTGGRGGGVSASGSSGGTIAIRRTEIQNNIATIHSGGIAAFASYSGGVGLHDSTVSGNSSATHSGGVLGSTYEFGSVSIENTYMTGNSATSVGGGVYLESGTNGRSYVRDSHIHGNDAGQGGGVAVRSYDGRVEIDGSTITANEATTHGGGVLARSMGTYFPRTIINDSTIAGNTSGDAGGGVRIETMEAGRVEVARSTVSGNSAFSFGGGVSVNQADNSRVQLKNSTLSGNSTMGDGGGLHGGPNSASAYSVELDFVTVANNEAAGQAGGLFGNQLVLDRSLIGNNTAGGVSEDLAGSATGTHSLIEMPSATATVTGAGNIIGQDPIIGPLADNGGPTQTHLLLGGSPARDAGGPAAASGFDQRGTGFDRVHGPFPDIGAVEAISADLNNDGGYNCIDVNSLVEEIAGGTNDAAFDLTADGMVNHDDLDLWLAEAGNFNVGGGFLDGDANLDGVVDISDLNIWSGNKFTETAAWCSGDFNADGLVDISDLNIWSANKFQSSARPATLWNPQLVTAAFAAGEEEDDQVSRVDPTATLTILQSSETATPATGRDLSLPPTTRFESPWRLAPS